MNKDTNTRLTLETEHFTRTWEVKRQDCTCEEIIAAMYGMLIGASWQPSSIIKAMKDFVKDHNYVLDDVDLCDTEQPYFVCNANDEINQY